MYASSRTSRSSEESATTIDSSISEKDSYSFAEHRRWRGVEGLPEGDGQEGALRIDFVALNVRDGGRGLIEAGWPMIEPGCGASLWNLLQGEKSTFLDLLPEDVRAGSTDEGGVG